MLPGMPLPSENSLAELHHVSRPTVRKALEMLQSDGLIAIKAGVGSFVSSFEKIASGRRLTIGIDSSGDVAPYYTRLIFQGVRNCCEDNGCRLILTDESKLNKLREEEVDGVIITNCVAGNYERYEVIAKAGIPIAMINRFPADSNIAYVSVDYLHEAHRAVEYLLMLGHRDIAILGADEGISAPGLRTAGWRKAFSDRGLAPPEHLRISESMMWKNRTEIGDFLRSSNITAVFVTLGSLMLPVIEAMGYAGVKVPDDMSLICFDDMEEVLRYCCMPVSYVKMPLERMGFAAAEYVIKKNRDISIPVMRRVEDASLVINHSCRQLND